MAVAVRDNVLVVVILVVLLSQVQSSAIRIKFEAEEEVNGSTFLGNIATEAKLSGEHSYKILPNDYKTYFGVNPNGDFYMTKKIDYEAVCPRKQKCELSLEVVATDKEATQNVTNLIVTVEVIDKNDNEPIFSSKSIYLPIQENNAKGATYELPSCSDADTGNNSMLTFTLVQDGDNFELEKHKNLDGISYSLNLLLKTSLDREVSDAYQILVKAYDGGVGDTRKSAELRIDINVTDMNDKQPIFQPELYNVTIDEDVANGTTIVNVTATDGDIGENARLSYSIVQIVPMLNPGIVKINEDSGNIYINGKFDGSTDPFTMYIVAIDHGNPKKKSTQARVIVNIRDKNDNKPIIEIDPVRADGTVMENSSVGTAVAYIIVEDADRGQNGLAECACDSEYFNIVERASTSISYVLQVGAVIDREELTNKYINVTINCTDKGEPPLSSNKSFTFLVADENDNSPKFLSLTYTADIVENNTANYVILKVSATDRDDGENSRVTYEIVPFEGKSKFKIEDDGVIRATGVFDRETKASYSFRVNATDQGNPKLFDLANITINILDLNDNAPSFVGDSYAMSVIENVNISTSIGQVTAQDSDVGDNGKITYSIPANYSKYPFRVLDDGTVILTQMLDREELAAYLPYRFIIVASDHGNPSLTSSIPVVVTVIDVNDNPPFLKFPQGENDTVSIPHKTMPNSVITTILATDEDDKDNKALTYSIESGNEEGLFQIDENTGKIILLKSVSSRDIKTFTLTISVKDKGQTQLETRATLHIEFFLANDTEIAGLVSAKKGQNILIAIIISCVTFVLSVIIIIIICVIRRKDRQKSLFNAMPYDQQKIMPNHRNSNRSSSSRGSNDKMIYPDNTYVDNGYQNKKGKKEVSFSLEEDHDGVVSIDPNRQYDPVSTFKSPSPTPAQNTSFHMDSLPPRKPERADDSRQRDIHRMTSLRVHQALIQNQNNNNSKWTQPTQEETTGKNYITLTKSHLDDTHSETSGEATTSDSGRGGSEEDIRNMTNTQDTEDTDEKRTVRTLIRRRVTRRLIWVHTGRKTIIEQQAKDEPRSPTSPTSHPFYTSESQQPTFSSFRGNGVHKTGPILASYLDHRPPSRTNGDVFKNSYPMNDLSNPGRNIPNNPKISNDMAMNPAHRNIHSGSGPMPTTSFTHSRIDSDPLISNSNPLGLNNFANSFENESLANRSQDDDNTTTTSGSYTINDIQDDLLMSGAESGDMFYKPDTFV